MEINRYIRTARSKDGYAPIRVAVYYHNKRFHISTGDKAPYLDCWDKEEQLVKSRQPFASVINHKLNNIKKILAYIYTSVQEDRFALDNASHKALFENIFPAAARQGSLPHAPNCLTR